MDVLSFHLRTIEKVAKSILKGGNRAPTSRTASSAAKVFQNTEILPHADIGIRKMEIVQGHSTPVDVVQAKVPVPDILTDYPFIQNQAFLSMQGTDSLPWCKQSKP